MRYSFLNAGARILNSGQSRSIVFCGNVHDLFFAPEPGDESARGSYQPLGRVLRDYWQVPGLCVLVYELNGPVRFPSEEARETIRSAWVAWRSGLSADDLAIQGMLRRKRHEAAEELASEFERLVGDLVGNPTVALEFLRQLCLCSRSRSPDGRPYLKEDLLILVEAADLLIPEGSIASMSRADRHRVGIVFDWFSEPEFQNGTDSVVLIAESPSLISERVARLPFVVPIEVPAPGAESRAHYLHWFLKGQDNGRPLELWGSQAEAVAATAGLSLHALRQLLLAAQYAGGRLDPGDVTEKVAEFIERQLGEDVVEFKRPSHGLADVVGFEQLKAFLHEELIPRFRSTGKDALPGAAVCGPIGGGKSFIFEAVAAELDFPVLVLKNIRSQWFGQTDVLFERLRRSLLALGKVMIFVDEADTQFGGVGAETHSTERRLTGKIQAMISDPALRGQIVWLLMTARIHYLSPDLRRPGRVGDLIIPVLDPQGEDRTAFVRWVLDSALPDGAPQDVVAKLDELTVGYSAAAFASLRSTLAAAAVRQPLDTERLVAIVADQIPPSIERTRRYQTLQALLNCTRRSLLPVPDVTPEVREAWRREIAELEREGIR